MISDSVKWFNKSQYFKLEIKRKIISAPDSTARCVVISDQEKINSLVKKITTIPSNGTMMISWSEHTEEISLTFFAQDGNETVQIYNGRFKTPTTGFNDKASELEKDVYRELKSYFSHPLIERVRSILHFWTNS